MRSARRIQIVAVIYNPPDVSLEDGTKDCLHAGLNSDVHEESPVLSSSQL